MTASAVLAVRQLQTTGVPPQRPHADPNLPTTPGSVVRATVPGAAHLKRAWELQDDGHWRDARNGDRRSPHQLRDVQVLWVAPSLDGAA